MAGAPLVALQPPLCGAEAPSASHVPDEHTMRRTHGVGMAAVFESGTAHTFPEHGRLNRTAGVTRIDTARGREHSSPDRQSTSDRATQVARHATLSSLSRRPVQPHAPKKSGDHEPHPYARKVAVAPTPPYATAPPQHEHHVGTRMRPTQHAPPSHEMAGALAPRSPQQLPLSRNAAP